MIASVSAGLARLAVLAHETPHDPDRIIRETLALVAETLGASEVMLTRLVGDTLHIERVHDTDGVGIRTGDTLALCDTYCQATLTSADRALVVEDTRLDTRFAALAATTDGGIHGYEGASLYRADGTLYGTLCTLHLTTHRAGAGEIPLLALAGRVIVQAVEACHLHESEHRFRTLIEAAPIGACVVDEHGTIEVANRAYCTFYGYTHEELIGQHLTMLVPEAARDAEMVTFRRDVAAGRGGQREATVITKGGEPRTVLIDTVQYTGLDGRPRRASYVTDISLHKAENELYLYAAHHDALTTLPNRALFALRLGVTLEEQRARGGCAAVLSLDLNGFKAINDTHGHEAGDTVLQVVAERLRSRVRADDTVARMGGDEFVVLLPTVRHAADAARVAANLTVAMSAPISINGCAVSVTPSIGVALAPQHGKTAPALLAAADAAMYVAKQRGTSVSIASSGVSATDAG